jgi:hypothetical protein
MCLTKTPPLMQGGYPKTIGRWKRAQVMITGKNFLNSTFSI